MLKSSSLCLYNSNLGTFWLKIEQFGHLKKFFFSNGGHLGYRTALTDTIFKGDDLRIISAKFGWDWHSSFRGEDFFLISFPLFLICIIGQNRQKFKVHKNPVIHVFCSSLCLYSSNLGIFWLKIEQFWPSWIQDDADGHNFERGPPKDHFSKDWLRLAQ